MMTFFMIDAHRREDANRAYDVHLVDFGQVNSPSYSKFGVGDLWEIDWY